MRSTRVRNIVATVLGVLAVLLLTVGTVAVWTRATVSSGERVAALVDDALDEPEVETALAQYVTDQIFTAVDIEALLTPALPNRLQQFAPVLVGGAQAAVERGLTAVIAEPRVQELVTRLVERAHAAAMRLLQGDGLLDGIDVSDGAVTINLLPLVGRAVTQVQNLGLLQDVEVPELTADGDPATQIAELETALDRDLPDDFGQLVVYQSDRLANAQASLARAQEAVAVARRALWLILVLSVVLIAAAILVAADRWRATLVLGLGVVVAMVVTRSAVERVVEAAPDLAQQPGGRAAIASIVGGASESLLRLAAVVLILGAVAAVVAMAIRKWRREDLVLAAAVLVGVLVVGVLGLTIVGVVLGIVLAVLVPIITWRVIGRTV